MEQPQIHKGIELVQKVPLVGFSFWSWWVLANAIGVALIVAVGKIIYIPPTVIGWIIAGASVGIMQQFVLRKYIHLQGWGWLSLIGWIIGSLVGKVAVGWKAAGWDIDWALVGLSVGIAQYLVLRRQVYYGGWWILASSTALVLASALGGATALLEDWVMFKGLIHINEHLAETVGFVLAGAVGGAVNGAITGAWLIWFLRSPSRQLLANNLMIEKQ